MKLKNLNKNQKLELILIGSVVLISLAICAFLSFQYFLLADFPIGHDVILHIGKAMKIEQLGLLYSFKSSTYPLASILFVFWHKFLALFGLSWERSFIFVECFYLFLTAILSGILSFKIFKDWRIAILTSFFVASSRWLNESLRIGLAAETLGWVFFVLSLILFFEKKWWWFLGSLILLFLSHPLPFGVLILVILTFLIFMFFFGDKNEKKIVPYNLLILVLTLIIFYLIFPEVVQRIIYFLQSNFEPEGERSLIQYVIDSNRKRVLFYSFAFFGFLILILDEKKKNLFDSEKRRIWFFVLFVTISFLLAFKHYLSIHYLSYRFYTYFEIATAILASLVLVKISDLLLNKKLSWLIIFPLIYFLIYPNWSATKAITIWQLNDFSTQSATPRIDREALKEIIPLLKSGSRIYSHNKWSWWFRIHNFKVMNDWGKAGDYQIYQTENLEEFCSFLQRRNIKYIYFSSLDKKARIEKKNFLKKIYDKNNIRIYEVVKN